MPTIVIVMLLKPITNISKLVNEEFIAAIKPITQTAALGLGLFRATDCLNDF